MITPADSCPSTSCRDTLLLSQLWQSDPQIPVETISTSTSPGPGATTGRCWISSLRAPTQTTLRFEVGSCPVMALDDGDVWT